jgi:hypothetical protein
MTLALTLSINLAKNTDYCLKNREKNSFSKLEFQKLIEQKLFVIIKGNFSALAVKRIREKSKNAPP